MLRNITLSAEKTLIEKARRCAESNDTTLNAEFRRWLEQYVKSPQTRMDLDELMKRFSYVKPGRVFTREEMNAR